MRTPKQERNEKIFLALTKIHRDIVNGDNKISWHKTFEEQGLHNPNCVTLIKNTLQKMNIIKIHRNNTVSWNRAYATPSPKLVEGIFLFAKQSRVPKVPTPAVPDKPSKAQPVRGWVTTTTWGTFSY